VQRRVASHDRLLRCAGMRFWKFSTIALAAALLASNAYWLFHTVDEVSVNEARDQTYYETCHALKQALKALPAVAVKRNRETVVRAAHEAAQPSDDPFEKEGETIVGWLAFAFAPDGSLSRVTPIWEPFECPQGSPP
jgi:hypothetical protein